MPRLPDRLRRPLTRRFQQSLVTIADRTSPAIQKMWDNLDTYDESIVEELTAKSAPILAAAKAASIRQATGYYATLSGVRPPVIGAHEVALQADMRQPFIAYWQALASGNALEAAVLAGRSRIEAVVSNYAVSSARQTGDVFVAKTGAKIRGWVRITDAGACDWCQTVAENTYKSADTADFGHDRCNCTTAPLFFGED